MKSIKTISLPSGKKVPILGQGTAGFGRDASKRKDEIDSMRLGFDLGMTLIDTAEIYGDGKAEEVIGEAFVGRNDQVYIVSKVHPDHADMKGAIQACETSLRKLKRDYIDLYLLHWKGSIPIEETLEAFLSLKKSGKIRDFGVSNYDVDDMGAALGLPGGDQIATNQVLYNLMRRGIEWDLLPWCLQHNIPVMAYSPIEVGKLADDPGLTKVASRHKATPAQVALAWVLSKKGVIVIPKASNPKHVRENREALELVLTDEDIKELEGVFPAPKRKMGLEMI